MCCERFGPETAELLNMLYDDIYYRTNYDVTDHSSSRLIV